VRGFAWTPATVTLALVPSATQLWIAGAGPSALLLADACLARGVSVGIVAPTPRAAWVPNYALWLDDAIALGVEDAIARRWPSTEVVLGERATTLPRGYALLDRTRLQASLLERCAAAGVELVAATLEHVAHDDEGVALRCVDGTQLRGRLFVDASGHGSPFVARELGHPVAYQVAWGELCELSGDALDRERVCFMDWRSTGPEEPHDDLPPTFLYALPHAGERVFVEETVLASRVDDPAALFDALAQRLHRRLARMGLRRVGEPHEIERCIIPMGQALPRADQRTLAFGGAASMVHPATGYLLTNVLRRRARVADAIARELSQWVGPGAPSRRIWDAIWTGDEVRAWRLYGFGLEVLCALDRAGIESFFAHFFSLPEPRWREFLSADASSPALMRTMLRYFMGAPAPIRSRLNAALWGSEGLELLRGFGGLTR
jgi:lycopene cyclase-like protein